MPRPTAVGIRDSMEKERAKEKAAYGGFEKYEVEGWSRTLQEASEILSDPKKMKAVAKCMDKKEASMVTLRQLVASKVKPGQQDHDES